MATVGTINMGKFCGATTLNVRIRVARIFRVRLFVAVALIRLAARVLGCAVKIKEE